MADLELDQETKNQIAKKAYDGFRCNLDRKNLPRHKALHEAVYRTASEEYAASRRLHSEDSSSSVTKITFSANKMVRDVILSKQLAVLALVVAIGTLVLLAVNLLSGH